MEIMVMLIAVSMVVACLFLVAFIWSVKTGQFEDTHTPGMRILEDDQPGEVSPKFIPPKKE